MAKFIELEPQIFVSPQLAEADFARAAASGIRSIVNNRPDGEAAGQLPNETAEATARRLGLAYLYQPVANLDVTDDEAVAAFLQALRQLPRPILFYCRSGTRCTILWSQASAARLGADRVIEIAASAGYDLQSVREVIDAQVNRVAATI